MCENKECHYKALLIVIVVFAALYSWLHKDYPQATLDANESYSN
jgi:hypothetical protein